MARRMPWASTTKVELKAMPWCNTRSVSACRASASANWLACTPALNANCRKALAMKVSVIEASFAAYTRFASRAWSISNWR
ncbi:hypothetical protein D3C79_850510 [compost metagenome]